MENFIEFINKIIPKRKKKIIFNNKKKIKYFTTFNEIINY